MGDKNIEKLGAGDLMAQNKLDLEDQDEETIDWASEDELEQP